MPDAWRNDGMVDVAAHVAPGAGRRAAGAGVRPHPRPHRPPVFPRTRTLEPRLRRQARRRPALSAVAVTSLAWAWLPRAGHLPADQPGRAGAAHRPAAHREYGRRRRPRAATTGPAGRWSARRVGASSGWRAGPRSRRPSPRAPAPDRGRAPAGDGARPDRRPRRRPSTHRRRPMGRTTSLGLPLRRAAATREGDNQAPASTPRTIRRYDVAFALVWATGDEVLNVNEAHAYASCSNCVTVAVAFQVVLIMDDAQVVVPQNLSVAANYACYRCITAAIASQLVLSVDGTPGRGALLALGEVWGRLTEFGQNITAYSLVEISDRLEEFKAEIVAILGDAPRSCPTRRRHRPPGRRPTAPPPTEAANPRRPARRPAHPPAHRPHHHPANRRRASHRRSRRPSRRRRRRHPNRAPSPRPTRPPPRPSRDRRARSPT